MTYDSGAMLRAHAWEAIVFSALTVVVVYWLWALWRGKKRASGAMVVLGVAWLALAGYGGSRVYRAYEAGVFGRTITKPAPEVALTDASGGRIALRDMRGKVVLLDFWASWCVPCQKARPMLSRLYGRYGGEGLAIIGISGDEDEEAWRSYLQKHGSQWAESRGRQAWEKFGVNGIPVYVLVDRRGNMRYRLEGESPESETKLEQQISKLLQE